MGNYDHVFTRELEPQPSPGFPVAKRVGVVVRNTVGELLFLILQQGDLSPQIIDLSAKIVIVFDGLAEDRYQIKYRDRANKIERVISVESYFWEFHWTKYNIY